MDETKDSCKYPQKSSKYHFTTSPNTTHHVKKSLHSFHHITNFHSPFFVWQITHRITTRQVIVSHRITPHNWPHHTPHITLTTSHHKSIHITSYHISISITSWIIQHPLQAALHITNINNTPCSFILWNFHPPAWPPYQAYWRCAAGAVDLNPPTLVICSRMWQGFPPTRTCRMASDAAHNHGLNTARLFVGLPCNDHGLVQKRIAWTLSEAPPPALSLSFFLRKDCWANARVPAWHRRSQHLRHEFQCHLP